MQRVGALDAVAGDDVRGVGLGQAGGQPAEVLDPELAVAVGERDELVAGRAEARPQGRPVAEVGRVVDGPHDAGMARPSARRRWPASGRASRR